jgi:hypothetical protein
MQAEADDDGKQHEVRQAKKNSVAPQLDLLARADGQSIDDARRGCGRVVTYGARLGYRGIDDCHVANLPSVFLKVASQRRNPGSPLTHSGPGEQPIF